ncbi:MAG: hypothetical protein HQM13_01040 [SAR324 cluster bacterium]|nr:hypothetical protein [SAR324 cluster bacterium]
MQFERNRRIFFLPSHILMILFLIVFLLAGQGQGRTVLAASEMADSSSPETSAADAEENSEENVFDDENVFDAEDEEISVSGNDSNAIVFNGFLETERGARVGESENHKETWLLANQRVRLKTSGNTEKGGFDLKLDFVKDDITRQMEVDIREARLRYSPADWMDLSIGRQVSTWGVGDLIFINDLFPKNWINLLTGRDIESLKDASDVLRMTSYFGSWSWDLVWTPEFDPDTTPTGCRFSVFDPNLGRTRSNSDSCGKNSPAEEQNNKDENGEIAMRLKTRWGSQELAIYGYNGFWKNPKGLRFLPEQGLFKPFYPRLGVYGFSSEGQLGDGIVFFETGLYRSFEDEDGKDPLIENSSLRMMFGYRYMLNANLTLSGQGMSEKMMNYTNYKDNLHPDQSAKDEVRNTVTLRLVKTAQQDTLRISFFVYHRPQHRDDYLRYWVNKRLDDHFDITAGGNLFSGHSDYADSEFGMLREDDNVFIRMKYIF